MRKHITPYAVGVKFPAVPKSTTEVVLRKAGLSEFSHILYLRALLDVIYLINCSRNLATHILISSTRVFCCLFFCNDTPHLVLKLPWNCFLQVGRSSCCNTQYFIFLYEGRGGSIQQGFLFWKIKFATK